MHNFNPKRLLSLFENQRAKCWSCVSVHVPPLDVTKGEQQDARSEKTESWRVRP